MSLQLPVTQNAIALRKSILSLFNGKLVSFIKIAIKILSYFIQSSSNEEKNGISIKHSISLIAEQQAKNFIAIKSDTRKNKTKRPCDSHWIGVESGNKCDYATTLLLIKGPALKESAH